jgi:hypothetical protein
MTGTVAQLQEACPMDVRDHSGGPFAPVAQGNRRSHKVIYKCQGMIKPFEKLAQEAGKEHDNKTRV